MSETEYLQARVAAIVRRYAADLHDPACLLVNADHTAAEIISIVAQYLEPKIRASYVGIEAPEVVTGEVVQ